MWRILEIALAKVKVEFPDHDSQQVGDQLGKAGKHADLREVKGGAHAYIGVLYENCAAMVGAWAAHIKSVWHVFVSHKILISLMREVGVMRVIRDSH